MLKLKLQDPSLAIWVPVAFTTATALALWWGSARSAKSKLGGDLHLVPKAQDNYPLLGRFAVVQVRGPVWSELRFVTHLRAFGLTGPVLPAEHGIAGVKETLRRHALALSDTESFARRASNGSLTRPDPCGRLRCRRSQGPSAML